jgi:hypothetical protein
MSQSFLKAFLAGLFFTAFAICGLGIGVAWLLVPSPPNRFSTAAFSFNLPRGWSCVREVTEYVCHEGQPPSDAIVIMTMKYRSPQDTLSSYEEHLRSPMPAVGRSGNAELISLKKVNIAGADWVEGILRDSEVYNYDTTYLAGTTAEVGILVTFSVHKIVRTARDNELRSMIESLVVYQH